MFKHRKCTKAYILIMNANADSPGLMAVRILYFKLIYNEVICKRHL
jgi:hypothetical protein